MTFWMRCSSLLYFALLFTRWLLVSMSTRKTGRAVLFGWRLSAEMWPLIGLEERLVCFDTSPALLSLRTTQTFMLRDLVYIAYQQQRVSLRDMLTG